MPVNQSQPDPLAKSLSHLAVGFGAAFFASFVLLGVGARKNSAKYSVLAGVFAVWVHAQLDMPVAKALGELGV